MEEIKYFFENSNQKAILNVIFENKKSSQIEISEKLGLSHATVSNIVKELKKKKIIKTLEKGESKGGRRASILGLEPSFCYFSSTVIKENFFISGLVNFAGELTDIKKIEINSEHNVDCILEEIYKATELMLHANNIPKEKLVANSIVTEGIIDSDRGVVIDSAHFNWKQVPLKAKYQQKSGIATFVIPTTHAVVFAYQLSRVAKGLKHIIVISIDSGIGAAIVIDKKIFSGSFFMAGEIGHNVVEKNGKLCLCGKKGCLETIASGPAIINEIINHNEKTRKSIADEIKKLNHREAIKRIFEEAENGNPIAKKVVDKASYFIADETARIINLLDPEIVIFTGFVIEQDTGIFFNNIKKFCNEMVVAASMRIVNLMPAKIGEKELLIGGIMPVYSKLFLSSISP